MTAIDPPFRRALIGAASTHYLKNSGGEPS